MTQTTSSSFRPRRGDDPRNRGRFSPSLNSNPDTTLDTIDEPERSQRDVAGQWIARLDDRSASIRDVEALVMSNSSDVYDLYVVRVIAGSREYRSAISEDAQNRLLNHPDETVRWNFIEGNRALDVVTLDFFAVEDPSPSVRRLAAARARELRES